MGNLGWAEGSRQFPAVGVAINATLFGLFPPLSF